MVAPQKRQTFNNGTEGALATAANSAAAGGSAVGSPIIAGTGAAIYSAAAAIRGAKGCHVTGVDQDTYTLPLTGTAAASASAQIYFSVDSTSPPGTSGWVVGRLRSASANAAIVVLSTGRVLQVQDAGGFTKKGMNGNAALPDGKYCVNLQATHGTAATDGTISAQLYNDAGTLVDSYTASSVNAGTADITTFQFGKPTGPGSIDAYIDDAAFSTGTASPLDFSAANIAPTLSVTAPQTAAAGASVTATATATDSDGSIASYAWSVVTSGSTAAPTLTGASAATVSLTAPTAGNVVTLQCVVTDNSGATATATTEVRVPLTGSTTLRPLALNGTGTAWTNAGGVATDGAALADESDTTYLESPTVTSTEAARRVRLQPANARSTLQVKVRLFTDTGTANVTVRLYENGTFRQAWTQALTTTPTDYTFSAFSSTVTAITDWAGLWLEVGATS